MSWGGGIKRDSLDKDFSFAVRERAGWSCERCGQHYQVGERSALHCSHVVGRRNKAVRYEPDNGFALDYKCHKYFTENPVEHIEWVVGKIGYERYKALRARSLAPFKLTPDIKAHIAKRLRAAVTEMVEMRSLGVGGRIGFESPYPGPFEVIEPAQPIKRRSAKKAKTGAKKPLTNPKLKRKINGQVVPREKAA